MRRSTSHLVAGLSSVLSLALLLLLVAPVHAQELTTKDGEKVIQGAVRRPLAPSIDGPQGLFRTWAAEILPPGSVTVGPHFEFFTAEGFTFPNTSTTRLKADLALSWSLPMFEISNQKIYEEIALAWKGTVVNFDDDGGQAPFVPEQIQVGSIDLSYKLARTEVYDDLKELHNYGLSFNIFVPSKVDEIGPDFGQTSVEIRALYTADFQAYEERWPPVKAHFNVGYFLNNISEDEGFVPGGTPQIEASNTILRFAHGQSVFDQIRFRLGAEYVNRKFTPFLELGWDMLIEFPDDMGVMDSPMWITPGVRVRPNENWTISTGVEIALVQAANPQVSVLPDWNWILGATYTHIPTPPPPPPPLIVPEERTIAVKTRGRITGTVYDADTNLTITGAKVMFPGRDLSPILTDTSGRYTTYEFEEGEVELRVEKEGYLSRSATPRVKPDQIVTQDFYLVPQVTEPQTGTFRGTVQSLAGEFLEGTVVLEGTDKQITTEAGVGQFVMELEAGNYTAKATSEGYLPETFAFAMEAGQVVIHDFVLRKQPVLQKKQFVELKGDRIEINQTIYFATGKAQVLEQSYPVLREVAEVMKETPGILLLEIGGHTDSRGSDAYNKSLSERRAQSVRQFLINEGVEPERLTAVGYGEEVPLVFPDDTPEKQARNRRVEFLILKRE